MSSKGPAAVKIFAHRGGRQTTPENTLAAFANSLRLGVHGLELDVQRCATGELVVIDDQDLGCTTDGMGLVKDIGLTELKKLSAGRKFGQAFEGERVPTLLEALDLIDGNLLVNIELKNSPIKYPDIEEDLLEVVSHYQYPDRLIISSLDHQLLLRISRLCELPLALSAGCAFYDLPGYAAAVGASIWQAPFNIVRQDLLDQAHQAGLLVHAEVADDLDQCRQLVEMGVDGIVSYDPQTLMEYLDQLALANDSVC